MSKGKKPDRPFLEHKAFQARVRARQALTGERYQLAYRRLQEETVKMHQGAHSDPAAMAMEQDETRHSIQTRVENAASEDAQHKARRILVLPTVLDAAAAARAAQRLLLFCQAHSQVWSTVDFLRVDEVDVWSSIPELRGQFWHIEVHFDDTRYDLHGGHVLHYRVRHDFSQMVALKTISARLAGLSQPDRAFPMRSDSEAAPRAFTESLS